MSFTFNLVDSPWISCIERDGGIHELGLRDALVRAHELREVCGESPLVTAALYRLLLAVLHRVFGPPSDEEWFALWKEGRWDAARLDAYFQKWRDRFDLFAAERPFYQAADPRFRPKSSASLVHHIASGSDATLFDHHTDMEDLLLAPAEAARMLVTIQAFGLCGTNGPTQSFTDSPCARGVIFLVQGETLFETLALNLVRYPLHMAVYGMTGGYPDDRPAWEMDDPFTPERSRPFGYLDYLTWQSRRVLLIPDAKDAKLAVRRVIMARGLSLADNIYDPMKHYAATKGKETRPVELHFVEGRALWRDSVALFRLHTEGWRPPLVFDYLAELVEKKYLDKAQTYRYLALGMASQLGRDKVYFYRAEHMPLPLVYLRNQDLVELLDLAEKRAEEVARQLWGAVRTLATYLLSPEYDREEKRQSAREELDALTDSWAVERRYWPRLELPFLRLVQDLAQDENKSLEEQKTMLERWAQTLQRTAWDAFEQVTANLAPGPRALKATVHARAQLAAGLNKVLHLNEEV